MIPYAITERVFHGTELHAFLEITKWVELVKETSIEYDDRFRCHELVRALHHQLMKQMMINTLVADGHYGAVDHSWLVFAPRADKMHGAVILDCYAVGQLPMVQLLDPFGPKQSLFYPLDPNYYSQQRDDIRFDAVERIIQDIDDGIDGKPQAVRAGA